MSENTVTVDPLDGVDTDPEPVHLRVPGTQVTYCGIPIRPAADIRIPPEECGDPDICPTCLAEEAKAE